MIWDQCKVTACEHAASEVGHEQRCLEVKVTEHRVVRVPSAEDSDDVSVDVGAEESISASGSKAAGSYIGGENSQRGAKESDSGAECNGDILRFNSVPGGCYEVAAEWRVGCSAVGSKVHNATGKDARRAK